MIREISRGACALVAVTLSACQTMPATDRAAEEQAIRAIDAAWVAAVAAGDFDKVASIYSDDAVFMPPNDVEKRGPDIRKDWAAMGTMKDVRLTFAPNRIEVDADGEMAIDVGTYEFSMSAPDGSKVSDHGKYAQVWEKHDGVWKCAVDMYNSSVPLPVAETPKKKKN